MLWCFLDYHPCLYDRPPCDQSIHEPTFGLVSLDGSLSPHEEILRRFAATGPVVQQPRKVVKMEIRLEEFCQDPNFHAERLDWNFLTP